MLSLFLISSKNEINESNPTEGKHFLSSNSSLNDSISSASNTASMLTYWKNEKKFDKSIDNISLSANVNALALSPATVPKNTKNTNHNNNNITATNQLLNSVQQNAQKLGKFFYLPLFLQV